MKIAMFHELPKGGARIAVNEIGKRLSKTHEVDLYYVDEKRDLNEEENYSHAYFYQFVPKLWSGKNWKARIYKDTIELYKLFKLNKRIAQDIRDKNYDLVFVNASKYMESPFLLKFHNTLKVFYLHDPHYRALYEDSLVKKKKVDSARRVYEVLNHFLRKILDRENLNRADVFLANSKFTQKMFKKTHGKESTVAYLGVDAKFFTPKKIEKKFDILFVGSHEPVDGYLLLKNAVRLMKRKPKIKTVFFEEEWLSREEQRELYRSSKIVLALGQNEPFGLIPLEAMACAVPVVAVDEGGYAETVIDGKTGYLAPRDPSLLAKKLDYLLLNENERSKMGEDARRYVSANWGWEKKIKILEKIFKKLT